MIGVTIYTYTVCNWLEYGTYMLRQPHAILLVLKPIDFLHPLYITSITILDTGDSLSIAIGAFYMIVGGPVGNNSWFAFYYIKLMGSKNHLVHFF